jgi:hypothetical protein
LTAHGGENPSAYIRLCAGLPGEHYHLLPLRTFVSSLWALLPSYTLRVRHRHLRSPQHPFDHIVRHAFLRIQDPCCLQALLERPQDFGQRLARHPQQCQQQWRHVLLGCGRFTRYRRATLPELTSHWPLSGTTHLCTSRLGVYRSSTQLPHVMSSTARHGVNPRPPRCHPACPLIVRHNHSTTLLNGRYPGRNAIVLFPRVHPWGVLTTPRTAMDTQPMYATDRISGAGIAPSSLPLLSQ